MDNNELDKILKEKLNGKIQPTKEVEDKVRQTIKEQQEKRTKTDLDGTTFKQAKNSYDAPKSKFSAKLLKFTSVAAMIVIIFTIGIFINRENEKDNTSTVTIKSIEPTKLESGILANDSEFLITVEEENASEESVRRSIYVDPPFDYTIKKTGNSNEYKLTFKQNIPDNTIVKLQYVKNQITEDSWAYQTSNKLSITETFPSGGDTEVGVNSTIEIEFSYASVENIEDHVEISPNVDGRWEHSGKVWRFIPSGNLQKDTEYTVKVSKGITAEDQTLEDNYIFKFATYDQDSQGQYEATSITVDGIYTYQPEDAIRIYYKYYNTNRSGISKIEISKFETVDDFTKYLEEGTYENAVSQGEYEFENIDKEYNSYVQLSQSLTNGYYVASMQNSNGKELFNCPIQINDLDVYAMESERDVVVWVASDGNLANNINVEYQGKTEKTNNQGIATFENIKEEATVKYMKVGNTENQQLVVGVYNYNQENYPNAYLYTDRLLYKNTDTINIWGFVPMQFFYEDVEDEFYIELNNEGKQKVEVGEDGNLNYKIDLKNHVDDDYAELDLYYKDTQIANRAIQIQNYELQNYTYEAVLDRNYVYVGEDFEFDIKVNHITGLAVSNKTVKISYLGTEYREKTDENGIAHFSIQIGNEDTDENTTGFHYQSICIYNGDEEEVTGNEDIINLYALSRNTYTQIERPNKNTFDVTLYQLAENKDINVEADEISKIFDGIYNTNVTINLIEELSTRYISGYEYDEYTKENVPTYDWDYTENATKIKTITTEDGHFEFDASSLSLKEDTEDVSYYYELEFVYQDKDGKEVRDREDLYYYEEYQTSGIGYAGFDLGGNYDNIPEGVDFSYYPVYRYLLKKNVDKFSIGDTVNLKLAESTMDGIKNIKNEGKILRIVFQEDVSKIDLIEDDNFDYTFTEEDFPGCKITSAYYVGGKFYRMPTYYFDFDEDDRKVDIEIKADKQEYKPGDEVTLTIKTTNNGNPIKTFVNISVVNEAVFELSDDSDWQDLSLAGIIYDNKSYPVYTYSSYFDALTGGDGGGSGGGPEARNNFGDTAYFDTVYTDSKGTATVKFTLPDNVTTYRVTAQSSNKDCYLGTNKIDITSTLDFFVQSTEPRKVKTTDDLVLNATSVAEENYDVEFEFTIEELDKTLTATAKTNSLATVNFGKLKAGKYHALITGKYGEQTDSIEYEFEIVESAQEVKEKTTVSIDADTKINPTKNPVVLEIYNKNMEQYLKYIDFIETTVTPRLDTIIAYNEVQNIKDKYYGTESSSNGINIDDYTDEGYFKNLRNSEKDLLLTALIKYFAPEYCDDIDVKLSDKTNLFEYYLYAAASNEPVLLDLEYLKESADELDNYNKLLLTLSFEFVGDFQNAKELYNNTNFEPEELDEYASIIALIDTFINKNNAINEINTIIENKPSDEYVRFAILSFFENNSAEMGEEETVTINSKNLNETITLNGLEVKTYTIYNEDLDTINFETSSQDLMLSYYYQTSIEEVEDEDIKKDISISLDGDLKKGNTVTLKIKFKDLSEGEVRIALPNSLRLANNYNTLDDAPEYYLESNNIDYVTFYKTEDCTTMEIPLLVTLEGNYKFENIVSYQDGIYHISNSLDFTVTE